MYSLKYRIYGALSMIPFLAIVAGLGVLFYLSGEKLDVWVNVMSKDAYRFNLYAASQIYIGAGSILGLGVAGPVLSRVYVFCSVPMHLIVSIIVLLILMLTLV